jgi:hypothetical protein
MSELLGIYPLKDRSAGKFVDATLWQPIDDRHLDDFDQKWKPIFDARTAQLESQGSITLEIAEQHNIQDAHWEWPKLVKDRRGILDWDTFAVEAEDVTQGLMLTRKGTDVRAREASQQNQYIVEIELLAIAPWNRHRLATAPQFKGIGRLLLAAAVNLSVEEEYEGRIGLHALPQAETWYRDVCQMTDLGVDKSDMRYFEMTAAQARAFIL